MMERNHVRRWFLLAVLFAAAYWIFDLAVLGAGVPHPLDDTWEDGLAARGLLAGQWFRTPMVYPPLWVFYDAGTQTVPVLIHGPVLPLLVAPLILWAGPEALDQIAWMAAAFAWLATFPLFRLASRHFGAPVAAAAVMLFTVSPLTLVAVHHYASVALGALLVTLAFDQAARPAPRPAVAGVVLGLAALARPEMLLAAPALAWLAASHSSKAGRLSSRAAAALLLAFAATMSWWWWHHAQATGNPFFNLSSYILLCFSPAHPGDGLVRDFAATPDRIPGMLAAALPELPAKWAETAPRALRNLLIAPTGATGWLVPVGLAVALARRESRRLAIAAFAVAAIPVAAMVLMVQIRHYLVPALPLFAIAAALGARWAFERLPSWAHRPRAWIAALALAALPSVVVALDTERREAEEARRLLADERRALAAVSAHDRPMLRQRFMFSDRPDFTAWTTGRPTLWITREELASEYSRPPRTAAGRPAPPELPEDTWFHAGHWARGERTAPP